MLAGLKRIGRGRVAKVLCILRHRGVQPILAFSLARHGILAADKSRGGNVFISSVSSLSFLSLSFSSALLSLLSRSLGDDTK